MSYKCPLCLIDPLTHSLTEILNKDNTVYYYTCPAKAKFYFDTNSIINHYNGVLSEIPTNKQWVWVFDSLDFGLKHFLTTLKKFMRVLVLFTIMKQKIL